MLLNVHWGDVGTRPVQWRLYLLSNWHWALYATCLNGFGACNEIVDVEKPSSTATDTHQ
jgi:hypothetical protein